MKNNPFALYDRATIHSAVLSYMARHQVKSVLLTDPKFLEFLEIFATADGGEPDYAHPDLDPCSERAIELRNDAWAREHTTWEEEEHERYGMMIWDEEMARLGKEKKI